MCSNPDISPPICPIRCLLEIFLIMDRMGEGWNRESLLFAFSAQNPDKKNNWNVMVPVTRNCLDALLRIFKNKYGVSKIAIHSCRKGFLSMCATAAIPQGVAKMLSRMNLSTLGHYQTCLHDTIALYHHQLFQWSENAFNNLENGVSVVYSKYHKQN